MVSLMTRFLHVPKAPNVVFSEQVMLNYRTGSIISITCCKKGNISSAKQFLKACQYEVNEWLDKNIGSYGSLLLLFFLNILLTNAFSVAYGCYKSISSFWYS